MSVEIDNAALRAALYPPAAAALREIGEQEVGAIRSDLSVPVVVGEKQVSFTTSDGEHVSFTAHGVIERSAPGEPPRKETGNLQEHVDYGVSENEGGPELDIVSSHPPGPRPLMNGKMSIAEVPRIMELGNEQIAPRPYMLPALDRIEKYVIDVFADHYARELS